MPAPPAFTHSPYGSMNGLRGPDGGGRPPSPSAMPPSQAHVHHTSSPQPTYVVPQYAHPPPLEQQGYRAPPPQTQPYGPPPPAVPSYAPQGFSQQLHYGPPPPQQMGGGGFSLPVMAPMQLDGPPLTHGPTSGGGNSRRRTRRGTDSNGHRLDQSGGSSGKLSGDFGKLSTGRHSHNGEGRQSHGGEGRNNGGGPNSHSRGSRRNNHHNNNNSHSSSHHSRRDNHNSHNNNNNNVISALYAAPPPPPLPQMHQDFSALEINGNFGRSGSYPTSNTTGTERDERETLVSGSSSSSVRDDLPLCENDAGCSLINDRRHQRQFSHTCRLFPCYHAAVKRHAKLFRHVPGQLVQTPAAPSGGTAPGGSSMIAPKGKHGQRATMALTSVNFMHISPDAPNATRITVSGTTKRYEISGDWTQVKLHTLKRYLHQVFGIPPVAQRLLLGTTLLDDDLAVVSESGVTEGCELILRGDDDSAGDEDRTMDL